jgi:hypothetical protein
MRASAAVHNWAYETAEEKLQLLPRFLFVLAIVFAAVRVVPGLGLAISLAGAVYALKGPKQTIEAFTLLAFLLIIGGVDVSMGRWLVLFAGCGRMIWDSITGDEPVPPVLIPLMLFSAAILVFAPLVSYLPVVSIFKAFSFAVGVGTVLVAFYRTGHLRHYWLCWFYTLTIFILFGSVLAYLTGTGYGRNGVGFQGILGHPQTYGPIMAPVTALFTGLLLFERNRSWLIVIGAVLGWLGMYASLSRTSLLAAVLSFCIAAAVALFKETWRPVVAGLLLRPVTLLLGFVLVFFIAFQWTTVQQGAVEFLLKDDNIDGSVAGALEASRGSLIERSMENFRTSPITGIGFGVPSDPGLTRIETGAFGLPVGASVEKGFMPSAVLEETGVIGAALTIVLLTMLLWPVVARGNITLFWMALSCLLINLGEMVFFSVGHMGFLLWIFMAFCYAYAWFAPAEARVQETTPGVQSDWVETAPYARLG